MNCPFPNEIVPTSLTMLELGSESRLILYTKKFDFGLVLSAMENQAKPLHMMVGLNLVVIPDNGMLGVKQLIHLRADNAFFSTTPNTDETTVRAPKLS